MFFHDLYKAIGIDSDVLNEFPTKPLQSKLIPELQIKENITCFLEQRIIKLTKNRTQYILSSNDINKIGKMIIQNDSNNNNTLLEIICLKWQLKFSNISFNSENDELITTIINHHFQSNISNIIRSSLDFLYYANKKKFFYF